MAKYKKNGGKPHKSKRTLQQKIATLIAGLLALLMLGSVLFGSLFSGAVVTQAEIDRLKTQLKDTTAKKVQVQKDINALASDKTAVREQITKLDEQIAVAEEEIRLQEELIEQLGQMVLTKTVELEASARDEQAQYQQARTRIRTMAEQGSMSYLSILLSADNFSDFLNRYEAVQQISARDTKIFNDLKRYKENVWEQKMALEEAQTLEEETKRQMDENKRVLEQQRADKQARMQNISNEEASAKAAYSKMIEEEEALMETIKKKAAELAAQQKYVGGTFMWPLPAGNNRITCHYGYRTHPVTGKKNSLHTGTDIAASRGTKIFAANGGTVVTSGYNAAYGNYVVINHGGGYTTLYAHMNERACKENDKVKMGDVIGYVGSTGYSTGPHLHFEISKDGKTMDPLKHEAFKSFKTVNA